MQFFSSGSDEWRARIHPSSALSHSVWLSVYGNNSLIFKSGQFCITMQYKLLIYSYALLLLPPPPPSPTVPLSALCLSRSPFLSLLNLFLLFPSCMTQLNFCPEWHKLFRKSQHKHARTCVIIINITLLHALHWRWPSCDIAFNKHAYLAGPVTSLSLHRPLLLLQRVEFAGELGLYLLVTLCAWCVSLF